MTRPYFTVRHVESRSDLPAKLERGRAYFVDDDQVIVIDHGLGPVEYGGKPGPQGPSGEPQPHLQEQIDMLAEASLRTQKTIYDLHQRVKARTDAISEHQNVSDTHFAEMLSTTNEHFTELTNTNAEAILRVLGIMLDRFSRYDSEIQILAKSIANLYPQAWKYDDGQDTDPLDGDTLTTSSGQWTIQQTYLDDGTIVLELEAQKLLVESISKGTQVDFDGATWRVSEYAVDNDGTITLSLTQ